MNETLHNPNSAIAATLSEDDFIEMAVAAHTPSAETYAAVNANQIARTPASELAGNQDAAQPAETAGATEHGYYSTYMSHFEQAPATAEESDQVSEHAPSAESGHEPVEAYDIFFSTSQEGRYLHGKEYAGSDDSILDLSTYEGDAIVVTTNADDGKQNTYYIHGSERRIYDLTQTHNAKGPRGFRLDDNEALPSIQFGGGWKLGRNGDAPTDPVTNVLFPIGYPSELPEGADRFSENPFEQISLTIRQAAAMEAAAQAAESTQPAPVRAPGDSEPLFFEDADDAASEVESAAVAEPEVMGRMLLNGKDLGPIRIPASSPLNGNHAAESEPAADSQEDDQPTAVMDAVDADQVEAPVSRKAKARALVASVADRAKQKYQQLRAIDVKETAQKAWDDLRDAPFAAMAKLQSAAANRAEKKEGHASNDSSDAEETNKKRKALTYALGGVALGALFVAGNALAAHGGGTEGHASVTEFLNGAGGVMPTKDLKHSFNEIANTVLSFGHKASKAHAHAQELQSNAHIAVLQHNDTIWHMAKEQLIQQGNVRPSNSQIYEHTDHILRANHISWEQASHLQDGTKVRT